MIASEEKVDLRSLLFYGRHPFPMKFQATSILCSLVFCLQSSYSEEISDDSSLQIAMANGVALGIPGISVAIGKGDEIIWTGTAGFRDLAKTESVMPDDLFGIGSITKSFVAAVILQLAAEKKLDLNQPVTRYLDDKVVGKILNAKLAPLRTLLNHQSGIPSWEFDKDWIRKGRGDEMKLDHIWEKAETLDYITREGTVAEFAPGEQYSYSNSNYTLLGLVVEAVTGNTLSEEIRRRLLSPLGMKNCYMESFEPARKGYVHHYHYDTPAFKKDAGVHAEFQKTLPYLVETTSGNLSPEWAAGGLVCSASDLVRWGQAVRGGKIIGAEIQKEMLANSPPKKPFRPGFSYRQAICRIENYHENKTFVGHSGGTLGFTGMMYWIEDTDIVIACLTNVGTMHSGLDYSPPDQFFSKILVPAILRDLKK
jgi:D-alanyl-D-alanine carboxypeptidase